MRLCADCASWNNMTLELSQFEKLLAGLVRAEVKFITAGGLACAMCGYIRTPEDVD